MPSGRWPRAAVSALAHGGFLANGTGSANQPGRHVMELTKPPNMRVQPTRTSASPPRSPLTCWPLGGSSAALFLVSALCWSADAAEPRRLSGSSGSGVVSPAVVATWIVREEPDSLPKLELLVLWRGTPGWFMSGDSQGSSLSGSNQLAGEDGRGLIVEQLAYGNVRLDVEFDQRQRSARVLDQVVTLKSENVILIDDVDGAEGPTLVGSRHVDPEFPELPVQIGMLIRQSPELVEFLRCDTKVPDLNAQPMFDAICARLTGP
jgi:hypothetical protein